MQTQQRQRKKGGGRKFADKLLSKSQFIRLARNWFLHDHSIYTFLSKYNLSRQAYYRFLNTHEWFKSEITESRQRVISTKKQRLEHLLKWLNDNPNKSKFDYDFRDIGNFNFDIKIENNEIKIVHKD